MSLIEKRKAQKEHTIKMTESDVLGNMALWYGRGKVVYRGSLTFKDDPDTRYNVILLHPRNENSNYLLSGMITEFNPQNAYPNRRPDKRQFADEKVLGQVYLYESTKRAEAYYVIMYFDAGDGQSQYLCPLTESQSDNPKAPVLKGAVRYFNSKESRQSENTYSKDDFVVKSVTKDPLSLILEAASKLSSLDLKVLANRLSTMIDYSEDDNDTDFEVIDVDESDDNDDSDDLPWKYEDESSWEDTKDSTPSIKVPSKKKRISEVISHSKRRSSVKDMSERIKNVGSNLVEEIDEDEII